MPPDFYLVMAAVMIALGSRRFFHALEAARERRRRRTLGALPLRRIADVAPGARVKIGGTVERAAADRRGTSFVVRDGSGAALVHAGSAALLPAEGASHAVARFDPGDPVTVVGVPRPGDPSLDGAGVEGRLVFAGAEAYPLYLVAGVKRPG